MKFGAKVRLFLHICKILVLQKGFLGVNGVVFTHYGNKKAKVDNTFSRKYLHMAVPTDVENVQTNQVQATKFFRDGQERQNYFVAC